MPKNILLLHTDQQRLDSLGCYGNAAARTPHLDRLAAEGVRFDHHYVTNPVCMPSRCSLLTGRHLPAHGVIDNGIPLDGRVPTMPAALVEAGYATYSAGKLHLTPFRGPRIYGFHESIDSWKEGDFKDWEGPYYGFQKLALTLGHGEGAASVTHGHYGKWLAEHCPEIDKFKGFDKAPEPKWPGVYRSRIPEQFHHSTYVADRVIEKLAGRDDQRPFFIFAGFPDPHHPFTPPESYAKPFDGVSLPGPKRREGEHKHRPKLFEWVFQKQLFPTDGGAGAPGDEERLKHIIQNTYASVSFIDHNIGRILEALERLGLANDTVVAFTTDHGEFLGDHNLLHKGQLPMATLMRVPLLVRCPGIAPCTVQAPVSNVDLLPTLMDLAGVKVPETVQGVSHVPVITGQKPSVQDAAFSCGWSKASSQFRHLSLHRSDWRLTWWPGLDDGELYYVAEDPDEFENLFHRPEHLAVREALLKDLFRKYASVGPLEPHVVCDW